MFYKVVKVFIRRALQLFCRKITINNKSVLKSAGPLLLACNHPNSFLDAIIVGSMFDAPVHFLARGDAFKKPLVRKILLALNMIPIYRLTEGREYLALNDATFERCRQLLLDKQIVLIFAEGLCKNDWTLRPLKKGAARIALDAWSQSSISRSFRVLPVSLNYNSFVHFGKRLIIHFGKSIKEGDLLGVTGEGERINHFNEILSTRLKEGMVEAKDGTEVVQMLISNHEIMCHDYDAVKVLKSQQAKLEQADAALVLKKLESPYLVAVSAVDFIISIVCFVLLLVPGFVGWILQAPLLITIKTLVIKKTRGTVFYDSVLLGLLLLCYPLYWISLSILSLVFIKAWYINILVLLMPLTAMVYLLWKDAWQRMFNYSILFFVRRKAASRVLQ